MILAKYAMPKTAILISRSSPQISSPDEVKISVAYAGICPDDLLLYAMDETSLCWPGPYPTVGHEFSGVITEAGENAQRFNWKPGDRVSGFAWNFCGSCYYCKKGMQNYCENRTSVSLFATEVIMNQNQICRLPDSIPLMEGIFTDPITYCMYNDLNHNPHTPFPNVLIFGANAKALLVVQLARLEGAAEITVVEENRKKGNLALAMGANHVIQPSRQDILCEGMEYTDQRGYDVIYEMARSPANLDIGVQVLAYRGTLLFSSMYNLTVSSALNLSELYMKAGVLKPFSLAPYMLEDAMEVISRLQLSPMITGVYPFDQINEAFRVQESEESIKTILEVTPSENIQALLC